MALTCKSAAQTPREVIGYQRDVRTAREVNIMLAFEKGAATVDELIKRMGPIVLRDIFYHFDSESGFSCHGHIEDSEVIERPYMYTEVRHTLISLERRKLIDRFKWNGNEPHLWFKL